MSDTDNRDFEPDSIVIKSDDLGPGLQGLERDSPASVVHISTPEPGPTVTNSPILAGPGSTSGDCLPSLGSSPRPLTVGIGSTFTGTPTGETHDQVLTKLGSNVVVSGLVAGAIGGFLGWVLSETIDSPDRFTIGSALHIDWKAALWVMTFAIALGFVLMGWEGFTSRSPQKMLREGGIGAALGLGAGLVGGFVAQAIYGALVDPFSASGVGVLIRGVGWAIFGTLVGLGLGFRGGRKSVVNGLIGGAAGGFVAGAIFQLLSRTIPGVGLFRE